MMAHILVVEDDPATQDLLRECLEKSPWVSGITVVESAEAAEAHLRQRAKPDLVLLDLRLPGKSGVELLAQWKSAEDTRVMPVVILTSSDAPSEVEACYRRRANAFMVKPLTLAGMRNCMDKLTSFWSRCSLPTPSAPGVA